MKLHHVAYLVKDINKAITTFEVLGYKTESLINEDPVKYDEYRDCDICFLYNAEDYSDDSEKRYVELVAPCSKESPVYGLMATYKNSPYHLCFISEDPETDIEELKAKGFIVMQEDAPAVAFGDKHVTFLMNRHIGIIELVYKAYK